MFFILLMYELQIFANIIHMISSFLWWSFTFMVVIIIRPLNKTGNLSIILPRIQKVVVYTSTVSIVSGIVFFSINANYQYYKLFYTTWGNIILVSGILSLLVYYNVISGGKMRLIFIKLKLPSKFYNQTPIALFSMITISLALMILIAKVFIMI